MADHPVLKASNRAFRYGDALFETIRCIGTKPAYFKDHYQRILNGLSALKMNIQSLPPLGVLEQQIGELIQKNRFYGDVRVRLTIYRADGGLYTPTDNKINYLIEASALSTNGYELNPKGLLVDIFEDEQKSMSRIGQFKTASSLLFVLAGLYKKEQGKDDVLITNLNNEIIEGLASNLFWIKGNVIYTPYRSAGCVDGIMRKQVIRILKENQIYIQEIGGTNYNSLVEADEIFLTNAIQGIQWVVGLKYKRFYCKKVKEINRLLNEDLANYMKDSQENSSRL